jgi:hypothetical protein
LDCVVDVTHGGGSVTGTFRSTNTLARPPAPEADFARLLSQAEQPQVPAQDFTSVGWRAWVPLPYASHGLEVLLPSRDTPSRSLPEQLRMYKEDQLLAHPGGDLVDLEAPDPLNSAPPQDGFLQRIAKDISDAASNLVNFFKDLLAGSTQRYVDRAGKVQSAQRRGLGATILEFFKDLASGLSFGLFRPEGEPEPQGILQRISFAWRKVVEEALMEDLFLGLPSSAIHLLDDAALTVWNLLEVVPDATVGNLPGGRELVTTVFDNGQVLIDYITDCLPSGEAWMRVHAFALNGTELVPPVLYNLKLPEVYGEDARWSTVRNTPFRKAIETVGSLLADVALARFTTHGPKTSKRRH